MRQLAAADGLHPHLQAPSGGAEQSGPATPDPDPDPEPLPLSFLSAGVLYNQFLSQTDFEVLRDRAKVGSWFTF